VSLDVYAHLISSVITSEMLAVRLLAAAVKTAHDMVHYRDPETGAHIDRMSRYARLIAQHLAATGAASLDDSDIECIFQFAPLTTSANSPADASCSSPDRFPLTNGGNAAAHGARFGNDQCHRSQFRPGSSRWLDLLRHIAESHHETMDGGGYPNGLHDREIPLEARIVAVADVFDALTSVRPYKPSWNNDQAFAWLRKLARTKFDEDCVDALIFNAAKVVEIQKQFHEPAVPPAPTIVDGCLTDLPFPNAHDR